MDAIATWVKVFAPGLMSKAVALDSLEITRHQRARLVDSMGVDP